MQDGSDNLDYAREFSALRRKAVRNRMDSSFGDADSPGEKFNPEHSQYHRLLNEITKSAERHAVSKGIIPSDFEYEFLQPAFDFFDELTWALGSYDDKDARKRLTLWVHDDNLLEHCRRNPKDLWSPEANPRFPNIDKGALESVVGEYLKLPYRAPAVDRLLIDSLLAAEFSAFADQMVNDHSFNGMFPKPILLHEHVAWVYVKSVFTLAFIVWGSWAAIPILQHQSWISATVLNRVAVAVSGLAAILIFLGTIGLPINWSRQKREKKNIQNILQAMQITYRALNSSGPISAKHINEQLKLSMSAGVIWPAPVFAMLDDVARREGWF